MKKLRLAALMLLCVLVPLLLAMRDRYGPVFFRAISGGIQYTGGTITLTPPDSTSGYTDIITGEWTAISSSGGSNGIYAVSNAIYDLSNAYAVRGRMDLRDSAEVDLAVNQLHSIDGLINLDNGTLTITDNVSVFGAAIHSVDITAGDVDAAGATGGTLNLFYGVWGPSMTEDFTAVTIGHQILTHAGTYCDYGFNVNNSGTMLAGLYIEGHASNSPSSFGAGVLMKTAAAKMTYGIDMDEAGIVTAEIRGSNGETLDNVTDGSWDLGGATLREDTDIIISIKTVIKTINLDSSDDNDDFEFDDTADNSTSQNVNMGAIIPAYAEVLSVQARCFETVGGSQTFQVTLGTGSAGNQLLAQTTIDAANEIDGTATGAGPKLEAANATKSVWINGDPSANWDDCAGAGRWSIMITYIDYSAVHTAGIP